MKEGGGVRLEMNQGLDGRETEGAVEMDRS